MIYHDLDPSGPLAAPVPVVGANGREIVRCGSSNSIAGMLEWDRGTVRGTLAFRLADGRTWGASNLSETGWVAFLDNMTAAWNRLSVEETYPRGATPESPSELPGFLRRDSGSFDSSMVELDIEDFRRTHDLATWLQDDVGQPSLWMMREGRLMVIEVSPIALRVSLSDTLWALEQTGEAIARRISGNPDLAMSATNWRNRYVSDSEQIKRLFIAQLGHSADRAEELLALNVVHLPTKRAELIRGLDEVSAAARMAPASIPSVDLAEIATEIRRSPRLDTPTLDSLAEQASGRLRESGRTKVRAQAIAIAEWLRDKIGLKLMEPADPVSLLAEWDVGIISLKMPRSIEAVSFWGEKHGPAIFLNPQSQRSQTSDPNNLNSGARRFTLAHEICHLLLDRDGSLPVAEVLDKRARAPRAAEHRAEIFACHFLLPLEAAAIVYRESESLESCLTQIMRHFRVTRSLAQFQLWWRGSTGGLLNPADYETLRRAAEQPQYRR